MPEGIDDLRRRLHEALDALAHRDDVIARLRADLEAAGRRLAEEAARRRGAEAALAASEHAALTDGPGERGAEGGRALARRAIGDLAVAGSLAVRALRERLRRSVRRARGS